MPSTGSNTWVHAPLILNAPTRLVYKLPGLCRHENLSAKKEKTCPKLAKPVPKWGHFSLIRTLGPSTGVSQLSRLFGHFLPSFRVSKKKKKKRWVIEAINHCPLPTEFHRLLMWRQKQIDEWRGEIGAIR
jgi:hypothetical protein